MQQNMNITGVKLKMSMEVNRQASHIGCFTLEYPNLPKEPREPYGIHRRSLGLLWAPFTGSIVDNGCKPHKGREGRTRKEVGGHRAVTKAENVDEALPRVHM